MVVESALEQDGMRAPLKGGGLGVRLTQEVFTRLPPFVGARMITYSLRAVGVRVGASTIFWGMPSLVASEAEPPSRSEMARGSAPAAPSCRG